MNNPPENVLGADLIWWRSSSGMRTTVTILWGDCQKFGDSVHVDAVLFNEGGSPVSTWRIPLEAGRAVYLDSAGNGPWLSSDGRDGVLALYACTAGEPSEAARKYFKRLYPIVDWRSSDGQLATIHSDQVIRREACGIQEFTEIVVCERSDELNSIVILNGEEAQPANSIDVSVRNSLGQTRSGKHSPGMAPFTVCRIRLSEILPGLGNFSGGEPLVVTGAFSSVGLFTRPYVETTGRVWGVYHAGNVYSWQPLPHFVNSLIGGEVNPFAVWSDGAVKTVVHLLHSHGDIEDDVWVSVELLDCEGKVVASRPRWQQVPRHGVASFDIAELLPNPWSPFRGHVSLTFEANPGSSVPRRLQALVEFRTIRGVARTMTWSDEWNSVVRLAMRDRGRTTTPSRSYFRVCEDTELTTEVGITNAGHGSYDRTATVHFTLRDQSGKTTESEILVGPRATRFATMQELFSSPVEVLLPSGLGVLLVESASDLANIAFTRHRRDGALAVEHFMALQGRAGEKFIMPAGS